MQNLGKFEQLFGFQPVASGSTVPTIEVMIVGRILTGLKETNEQDRKVMRDIDQAAQAALDTTTLYELLAKAKEQEDKINRSFNAYHDAVALAKEFGRYVES